VTRRRLVFVVLVLAVAGYGLSGVTLVRPGERAVVRRFGRVLDSKPEPGLWIGLPWGMDRVDHVPVDQVQTIVAGYREEEDDPESLGTPTGQLLTGDHNLVNVQVSLNYKVRPEQVTDYVVQADRVEPLLTRAAEAVLAEWVAQRTVDEVLLNGKAKLRPVLLERVQQRLDAYGLGIELSDARVTLLAPPREVREDFESVARAQTAIQTKVTRAQQETDSDYRNALAERYRLEQESAAYATNAELQARAEGDTFLRRLRQYQEARTRNPDYLRQIWEEERNRLFASMQKSGRIGPIDQRFGKGGLDILMAPLPPKK
jgi:modulator of FtsH protease HflK